MSKKTYAQTLERVKAQGDWDFSISETEAASYREQVVPEGYDVTDFGNDEIILSNFEALTDYLAENQSIGRYAIDQATTGQTEDPAEYMRDLTFRLGAPLSLANSLKDAPEEIKQAYRTLKTRWDKASISGAGEVGEAVLDYGSDFLFSPEGLATMGGILSGVTNFGASSAASLGARKAAQVAANNALAKAVKASYAASVKNPLTATTLIGSGHGMIASHLGQELDISADIMSEEDYSHLTNLTTGVIGGAFGLGIGAGIQKGVGLYANSKLGNKAFRDSTESPKEMSIPEGSKAYDEAVEGEWMPASSGNVLEEALRLEGRTATVVDGTDNAGARTFDSDALDEAVKKFADDLGGGELTQKEIKARIRAAAANETTVEGRTNAIKQGIYTVVSDISGNFYGKAAGVLSPITKFSGTAAQLQKKLSHEFGIKYKVQDELVEKDLSEVQREVTGKMNERFRAIVDRLSLSEIDTKFATDINAALSKSLRSTKPIKFDEFDAATNAAINKAALEVKGLYNEMGVDLQKIGIITNLTDNYVPRMWSRKAVEDNQDELEALFVSKGGMSKAAAKATVKNMLDVKNQIDMGGGGGHFFSAKRKINTIADDSDFEKFLNSDVLGTLHAYTFQYGKSLAKHRVLGVNSFEEFEGFYINRIKEEMQDAGQEFTPKIKGQLEKLYRTATGEGMERFGRKTQIGVDAYSFTNRVALLGMATLSSLTEVFINIGKAGVRNSVKGFGEAIEQSHRRVTKDLEAELMNTHGMTAKEALTEMRNFSIHVDQALAQVGDRLAGDELMTEALQTASNKFFRLNLLDQWTKFVQNVSHSSGKSLINENIEKLAVRYKNLPMDKDGEILAGELAELGIDYKKAVDWYNGGAKRTDDFYKNDFLGGVARYTNSVVLQPTAMSGLKPLLFSNPKRAVLFQLLSYPAAFTNTVLKGAAKSMIKAPKKNVGKTLAAGTIMTGMARWSNYVRTDGESERGKDTDEIIMAAIARWGGNGLLLDSFQRAQTATKYTKSNLSYAAMPFGPAVSDTISLIQQGIIPTVGNKVPLLSGSYFGKEILGEPTVRRYRRGLKQTQKDVFGGLIQDFDETPSTIKFNLGGTVRPLAQAVEEAVSPALTALFKKGGDDALDKNLPVALSGDVYGTLSSSTKGYINPEAIREISDNLEGSISLRLNEGEIQLDEPTATSLAEANISTLFNSRTGYLEDAEASINFKNAINATDKNKINENLVEYQKELGYTDDQILALQTIQETEDVGNSKVIIENTVYDDVKELRNTYDRINIKVTDKDRADAELTKFDEESLDATHDFITELVKYKEPMISMEGAPIIARDAIVKIAARGNVNFSKFKAPKINPTETPERLLSEAERTAAQKAHVKDSDNSNMVYRSISRFKNSEFNVSFTFSNEMGTNVGSLGVAKTIQLRDAMYDAMEKGAGDKYTTFKNANKKPTEADFEKKLQLLEKVADANGRKIQESIIQTGYMNVKNPLIYESETIVGNWKAVDILADKEASLELLGSIERSGVKITQEFADVLNPLRKRAKEIQARPRTELVDELEANLMENELTIDLRTELQGLGFDGIKYLNEIEHGFEGESAHSYVLFEPNQFKLSTSAAFDSKDSRHNFMAGSAVIGKQVAKYFAPKKSSGLFSLAQKEAASIKDNKNTGEVMLKRLEGKVPQEELEWTGAKDYFKDKPEVTREEMVEYFDQTDFDYDVYVGKHEQMKRGVYDDDTPIDDIDDDWLPADDDELFDEWMQENNPYELSLMEDLIDTDSDLWDEMHEGFWDEWVESKSSVSGILGRDFTTNPAHISFSFEGENTVNYREMVLALPEKFKKVERDYVHTAHFRDIKNPILHIRFADIKEVKSPDTRTLLIDELQSDKSTAATGKEGVGYHFSNDDYVIPNENRKLIKNLEKEYDTLVGEMEDLEEILEEMTNAQLASERGKRINSELESVRDKMTKTGEAIQTIQSSENLVEFKIPTLPLKKEKSWASVGLRKSFITAAEEGYDQVALTSGRIQAERNSKVGDIDEAILFKRENMRTGQPAGWALQGVSATDEFNDFLAAFDTYEEAVAKLPKIIGQKNADELLASTPDDVGDYSLKKRMRFEQGGKKFYEFYDKSLPKMMNQQFGKKYGVEVKMVEYKQGDKVVELPTLEITDEMRQDILKGLPMFAEGGYVVESGDTLSQLAKDNNTTVASLAEINNIEDVNKIYVGQTLNFEPSTNINETVKAVQAEEPVIQSESRMLEGVPEAISGAKESILKTVSGSTDAVVEKITQATEGMENVSKDVQSTISETLDTVSEGVSAAAGSTVSALRKLLGADFSSKGRTAENTTGTTASPEPVDLSVNTDKIREAVKTDAPDLSNAKLPDVKKYLMGDMTMEQLREANTPDAPDLSNTELPDVDFSSKGRTAENTMGTNSSPDLEGTKEFFSKLSDVEFSSKGRTAENTEGTTETPEPTSIMGDMTAEQLRDANKTNAPDLSEVSKKRKASRIVPTMIRQLIYDISGGEETLTEDDLMDSELQSLIKIALEKEERGSSKIEYKDYKTQSAGQSQYADVGGGGGVVDFFKKLNSPAYSMKTTLGQARLFKNDKGETIVSDRYNFNDSDGTFKLLRFLSGAKNAGLSFYGQARNIGREFGSPEGEGSHVLINLGVLDSRDMDNLVAAL
jgi:hypothetical protein